MPTTTRRRGNRAAWLLTLLYLAVILLFPLYLSRLRCLPGLTHQTPIRLLARNWLACHWPEEHLDIGAYGNWLTGTLLIPLLFWIRRAITAVSDVIAEQRRGLFLATLRQQHESFEMLALRIDETLRQSLNTPAEPSSTDPLQALNARIQRLLRVSGVEVKATLRRTALVEEYVAEGNAFLISLQRFDLPAYSGGPWRDLLHTLERLVGA